ncbi:uncharacterized protein FOMMEDRAFT_166534 [Fomitiporia mediterranea MF3/22]|uniref:uncharacterized protein n=1 Tax=Fomitiporia mediterranea (strain MF3/22) TaxID=694068 RepID=UPI000440867A|nr:uncharacterized protein FOMMEDRAFT_166534 [Fomitiporia mediterranea MF3/22]EJD04694.1 hypothetical protein FOMMEDRAFT_166534 [Fomitiporia mediterranea MF3/22]
MPPQFLDLTDDILLAVLENSQVKDILSTRQTCRRLNDLTRVRSVWLNACNDFVLDRGLPFPYKHLDDLGVSELEWRTRRAVSLTEAWASPNCRPRRAISFMGGPSSCLQSVHFVLRRDHEWIITQSEGIWPMITCWDLNRVEYDALKQVGRWYCEGASIGHIVVDNNIISDASLAVSIDEYCVENQYIRILKIRPMNDRHDVSFETLKCIDTDFSPVSLDGDILVTSDDYSKIHILNWRTDEHAILKSTEDLDEVIQHNKCLQVLFAHESIFVARSCSVELFPKVTWHAAGDTAQPLTPLQTCSFGWIDGIAMAPLSVYIPQYQYPPIVILVRAEQGDPWESDIHSIKYCIVSPDPAYFLPGSSKDSAIPYCFPPVLLSTLAAKRDFMHCPTLALGSAGTSMWLGSSIGRGGAQVLRSMIWQGPIADLMKPEEVRSRNLLSSIESGGATWNLMDYVEHRGCIALGAVDGSVKVLYMVD